MRLFGVRMPGMSPRDADEQVMGEVTDVPPYRRAKGDRNLIATLTLSRYVLKLLRSPDLDPLELARADARAWLATMPDVRSASDEQLLGWLRHVPAASSREHEAAPASSACSRGRPEACSTASSPARRATGDGEPHRGRHR